MQIYAYDKKNRFTTVHNAERGHDYYCIECKNPVRLRGGRWHKLHFYHTQSSKPCFSSSTSLAHLYIQHSLQKKLGTDAIYLEKRFDAIHRIADVCWPEKKIIFEIQCSPISATEVQKRNLDYSKMGYQVVWILYDKRFNKKRVSSAEIFLQTKPHYFAHLTPHSLVIYDQNSAISNGKRAAKTAKFPVSLDRPLFEKNKREWPLRFEGDLSNHTLFTKKRDKRPSLMRLFTHYLLKKHSL